MNLNIDLFVKLKWFFGAWLFWLTPLNWSSGRLFLVLKEFKIFIWWLFLIFQLLFFTHCSFLFRFSSHYIWVRKILLWKDATWRNPRTICVFLLEGQFISEFRCFNHNVRGILIFQRACFHLFQIIIWIIINLIIIYC